MYHDIKILGSFREILSLDFGFRFTSHPKYVYFPTPILWVPVPSRYFHRGLNVLLYWTNSSTIVKSYEIVSDVFLPHLSFVIILFLEFIKTFNTTP